jgi:hypothetical protein
MVHQLPSIPQVNMSSMGFCAGSSTMLGRPLEDVNPRCLGTHIHVSSRALCAKAYFHLLTHKGWDAPPLFRSMPSYPFFPLSEADSRKGTLSHSTLGPVLGSGSERCVHEKPVKPYCRGIPCSRHQK